MFGKNQILIFVEGNKIGGRQTTFLFFYWNENENRNTKIILDNIERNLLNRTNNGLKNPHHLPAKDIDIILGIFARVAASPPAKQARA